MQRDLMRSYAAGYWQTLLKLRLPAALPFLFNALKINSTLALIGAIVAEFFRLAHLRHGVPHQCRSRTHECRCGLGDDRRGRAGRFAVLRCAGVAGTALHVVARVFPGSMNSGILER